MSLEGLCCILTFQTIVKKKKLIKKKKGKKEKKSKEKKTECSNLKHPKYHDMYVDSDNYCKEK